MLSVSAALAAANVPGWRGAFRPTDTHPEPPAAYCVFTTTRAPDWPLDDGQSATRIRAFLHLYSRGDPESAEAAIRSAMAAEGFSLIDETDGYVPGAEDYEVLSEWAGLELSGRS